MKPKKITEREFAVPMLAVATAITNEAADLDLKLSTLIVVAVVSCVYAGLRVFQKVMAMKYGYAVKPTETVDVPTPPKP